MGRKGRKRRARARARAAEKATTGGRPDAAELLSAHSDPSDAAEAGYLPGADALADDPVVVDLDAESDEGEVSELIAETLSVVPEEVVQEPQLPVIDLDAEPPSTPAAPDDPPAVKVAHPPRVALPARDDVSTPDHRSRLLAEALAHAEHQDARYRVPHSDARTIARWKTAAAAGIFLLAGMVALVPPAWVRPEATATVAAAALADNLRVALLLQAQQVEAYRIARQSLPPSLDELPAALAGIRYVRSGSRAYQLIAYQPNGDAIVYDSVDPAPAFAELRPPWADAQEEQ